MFDKGIRSFVFRYFAATQFQKSAARKAFPCFDEPRYRSVFKIGISYPQNMKALSNAKEESKFIRELHWAETTFEPTIAMPTYLMAIVVGDFVPTRGRKVRNTQVTAIRSMYASLQYPWTISCFTPEFVSYLEHYFDAPYPLEKFDMVALPIFNYAAMESWGIVLFNELKLICDSSVQTTPERHQNLNVNSHEAAHMWAGNLVGVENWRNLWISEGLATYFSYKAFKAIPELAPKGMLTIDHFFDIVDYLKNEQNFAPWKVVNPMFNNMGFRMREKPENLYFMSYARKIFYQPYENLNESSDEYVLFKTPVAIRRSAYCYAIQQGSEEEFSFALKMLSNEVLQEERCNLIYAILCTQHSYLIRK
ncbi:unnamed protein product [Soboliphyme baturini]|uniref:Peptidase_M1 domain-containing protein n=1 Tax=Soboliphyme baturini TaxID=241478 RepID=A0A183IJJ3_9BILA|nr:unnamed protein product [Soboliphyme baturini]